MRIRDRDMERTSIQIQYELVDGLFLGILVLFAGWVALTQHATLGAPTTAICTAALLSPKVKTDYSTLTGELYRPVVALGTCLTAFQWLLSTTQPLSSPLPVNLAQSLVIQVGWMLSITLVITNPFVLLITRLRTRRGKDEERTSKFIDYGSGIACSFIAYVLVWFMLDISEVIHGVVGVPLSSTIILTISVPVFGWLVVFTERRRLARRGN